ncbi:MAG: type II toxin-antitoxin system prevent-host-death family antitoxin [Myxococcaceae bacterium]
MANILSMERSSHARVLLLQGDGAKAIDAKSLRHAGFQTESASQAAEALRLAAQQSFDVVVCDLDAPGLKGFSLLERLHEQDATAVFVLISSDRSNEFAVRATEAGALQLLEKPVDAALLVRAVTAATDRSRHALSLLRTLLKPSVSSSSVAATDAKNEFGAVLDSAVRDGAVVITKHDAPKAVLVSVERMSNVLAKREPDLRALSLEFDTLVAKMQTPAARAAAKSLFSAQPKQFGEAAAAAVSKRRE